MLSFQAYTIAESAIKELRNSAKNTLGIDKLQPYLPIYERFFNLDAQSRLSTTIRSKFLIANIESTHEDSEQAPNTLCNNLFANEKEGKAHASEPPQISQKVFYKVCPLVDALDYLLGEDATINSALTLPSSPPSSLSVPPAICDSPHNRAYTDAFFVYLSSRLLNNYNFVHGLHYYGAFTGLKENFRFDFSDDISEPWESDSFMEGIDNRFTLDAECLKEGFLRMKEMMDSAKETKPPLGAIQIIGNSTSSTELGIEEIFVEQRSNSTQQTELISGSQLVNNNHQPLATPDIQEVIDFPDYTEVEKIISQTNSESGGSDRTSVTTDEDAETEQPNKKVKITNIHPNYHEDSSNDDSEWSDIESNEKSSTEGESESESESESSDEELVESAWCTIPKIAVAVIAQECLTGTLEDLIEQEEMEVEEWRSCLFQICANLYAYNKAFDFVHNDLHAANIMWLPTDKSHLHYVMDEVEYSVPTFGRIFKIIDFGRATYRFGGLNFLNDCFESGRDAATQYNYDRIYDQTKDICEPNYAFDLCRLACSLYDYFDKQECYSEAGDCAISHQHPLAEIAQLIESWCLDDAGKNILYKESGAERYPGFKLYRMIARKVTHHVPQKVLQSNTFHAFKSLSAQTHNNQNKSIKINIDEIRKEYYRS
jgi:hypothetical protein